MQLLTPGDVADFRGGIFAIGNFDGVHRGHRAMIDALVSLAHGQGQSAAVVTFDPHPLALLRPAGAPPSLTTIEERGRMLRNLGVDAVIVLPTTWDLLRLSAEEFFTQVVVRELSVAGLVEGPNFYFGKDRGGNITLLRQLCQSHGVSLTVIDPVTWNGQWVSSSVIRSLLLAGDMQAAVDLLGHPYRLTGRVVRGAERGRQLGFPTANLSEIPTLLPGFGVYAGRVRIGDDDYAAAVNIGSNPTFGEQSTKIEAHILGYAGDLYGQQLNVDLVARLREIRTFASREALQEQLSADSLGAQTAVGSFPFWQDLP